jgi:hypothetical protein
VDACRHGGAAEPRHGSFFDFPHPFLLPFASSATCFVLSQFAFLFSLFSPGMGIASFLGVVRISVLKKPELDSS